MANLLIPLSGLPSAEWCQTQDLVVHISADLPPQLAASLRESAERYNAEWVISSHPSVLRNWDLNDCETYYEYVYVWVGQPVPILQRHDEAWLVHQRLHTLLFEGRL